MTIFAKRAGAIALAATFCAGLFGAAQALAASEASLEAPITSTTSTPSAPVADTAPEAIRFVAESVVQALPTQQVDTSSLTALVASMPEDAALSRDMRCLAQAIYFEARGEELAGQLAVARVVINRAESGRFPSDYCGVVTQRGQFSFVRRGQMPNANENSQAWRRATALAQIAHQDLWDSPADDALFFHATYVRPGWAKRKVATIDNHIFYR